MRAALLGAGLLWALALAAAPAGAEVKEQTDSGFTVGNVHKVPATPAQVWAALVKPATWWNAQHSWSGDAKNLSLDPVAGGCYCERWAAGSAEHARVVRVMQGSVLVLRGAFGPLQGEALTGVLTVTLKAEGALTTISADYVVGGHARFALKDVAPAVDSVIGEQFTRLAGLFPKAP